MFIYSHSTFLFLFLDPLSRFLHCFVTALSLALCLIPTLDFDSPIVRYSYFFFFLTRTLLSLALCFPKSRISSSLCHLSSFFLSPYRLVASLSFFGLEKASCIYIINTHDHSLLYSYLVPLLYICFIVIVFFLYHIWAGSLLTTQK